MSSNRLRLKVWSILASSSHQASRASVASGRLKDHRITTRHYSSEVHTTSWQSHPSIKQRSCLITGATSGIGFAVLTRLLADGASHVRIISRDRQRANQAVERARRESDSNSGQIAVIEQDLEDPGLDSSKFFAADDDWPAINTFIHCAGVSQSSLAMSTPAATSSSILRINVQVYMQLLADLLKSYHSLASSRGKDASLASRPSYSAVGVSSLLAIKGGYGTSTYAASKAAMVAYNRALTLEAGQITRKHGKKVPGFRVNTLVPGYIDTPMISNFTDQVKTDLQTQIPSARFGTPDEVADAVMFLLQNEYANNCVLNLDGGLSAT